MKLIKKILIHIYYRIAKLYVVIYHRLNDRKYDCIVSLTSYGTRLSSCYLSIISILCQSVVPKEIFLFIGNESSKIKLPKRLTALQKYGLKIVYVDSDIKGHKKYYYIMKQRPESILITIDDDCIYSYNTIKCLVKTHRQHPEAVVARRVHKITCREQHVLPYNNWIIEWKGKQINPTHELIAIGVGGVLYPPYFAKPDLFDKKIIFKYALSADDIWLKFFELRHNIKVVWASNYRPHPISIPYTQNNGLYLDNVNNNKNDQVIQNLEKYYKINISYLIHKEA